MRQERDNKDWLAFRRNHIQASDSFTIWEGKDAQLFDLWLDKMGLGEEVYETEAMRHGKSLEPVAREFFNTHMNDVFFPEVVESKEHPFMGASLDGINTKRNALLEIKCPWSSNLLEEVRREEIPIRYICQTQHQMMTTGIHKMYFLVFKSPYDFHITEIEYSKNVCDVLLEKERVFWNKVQSRVPPMEERRDEEWISLEQQYLDFAVAEKEISRCKEEVLEQLKQLANGKTAFGPSLMLTKYTRRGNVDYGKIPELSGVDLDKYRKETSECWRANKR